MKAILNNEIIDWEDIKLTQNNRAFKYGDGLFETVAVVNGRPRLLDRHLERLQRGAKILRMNMPAALKNTENISAKMDDLLNEEKIAEQGKVKIYLWRNSEGLYTPKGSDADFLLAAESASAGPNIPAQKVGISLHTVNYYSEISRFKTMNALKYVTAGIEKEERRLDEIIITDQNAHISEALHANIFIKLNGVYLTPPISTGCIEGVMRNYLLEELRKKGKKAKEAPFTVSELKNAQSIFISNAGGIRFIAEFEGVKFAQDPLISELTEATL